MKLVFILIALWASISNANVQRNPSELISFFRSIQGKGIISGQFIEMGRGWQAIQDIYSNTGKWVGLIGGDYWWFGSTSLSATTDVNANAKDYWSKGGLFILSMSMANPTTGGAIYDVSNLAAGDILKQGTSTNRNFMLMIDSIANGLQDLKNNGVTVIIRPFHESNGNWFWWGTKLMSPDQFAQMFRFVHDYFTNNKGLNNLVWLFSANAGLDGMPINNYPGSDYVDMIGLDVYTNNPQDAAGDFKKLQGYNKVLCLAEFGSGSPQRGDPSFQEPVLIYQAKTALPQAVFFQQWWDGNGNSPGWGIGETQNAKQALEDPYCINRGQFDSFFNRTA